MLRPCPCKLLILLTDQARGGMEAGGQVGAGKDAWRTRHFARCGLHRTPQRLLPLSVGAMHAFISYMREGARRRGRKFKLGATQVWRRPAANRSG